MTTNPVRWTDKLRELYGKPPYDPTTVDGFDSAALQSYNAAVREIARDEALPLIDVYDAYCLRDSNAAASLLVDGMHPNDQGHQLVADQLMPVIRRELP